MKHIIAALRERFLRWIYRQPGNGRPLVMDYGLTKSFLDNTENHIREIRYLLNKRDQERLQVNTATAAIEVGRIIRQAQRHKGWVRYGANHD